jgi:hypothetical protein
VTNKYPDTPEVPEDWQTPEYRAKQEAWRGGTTKQPEDVSQVSKSPSGHISAHQFFATGALSQLANTISIGKTLDQLSTLRSEVEELRAWKAAHSGHVPRGALSGENVVAILSAARSLSRVLRELFGDSAHIEVRENDDESGGPILFEAHYGIVGPIGDDVWDRHSAFLGAYLAVVPENVRRLLQLMRTVR